MIAVLLAGFPLDRPGLLAMPVRDPNRESQPLRVKPDTGEPGKVKAATPLLFIETCLLLHTPIYARMLEDVAEFGSFDSNCGRAIIAGEMEARLEARVENAVPVCKE
jgi:hypothetical protein